jgi:hypothetical protein
MHAPVIRCTCPRCHGRKFDRVAEYLTDHQGQEVYDSEVELIAPPWARQMVFTADCESGEQVLVNVWPWEHTGEVAFRPTVHDTWSPPIFLRYDQ